MEEFIQKIEELGFKGEDNIYNFHKTVELGGQQIIINGVCSNIKGQEKEVIYTVELDDDNYICNVSEQELVTKLIKCDINIYIENRPVGGISVCFYEDEGERFIEFIKSVINR